MSSLATTQAALDYARMEKAIGYLQSHYREQPKLSAVARAAHLSEYHFQRVFSRWAGISPKRFLQYLTIEHAKEQLTQSKPLLETALDAGLSSSGRLHDLFVSVEAVTPGEFKTRGDGIQIDYGFHPTPFGTCLIGMTARGICWLSFPRKAAGGVALRDMRNCWSGALLREHSRKTGSLIGKIFAGFNNGHSTPLNLLLMGTNFQIKVWQALLAIPSGHVATYEAIGTAIGTPKACRAIGSAVGKNTIAFLVPCHRVIRKTGGLGGYRWGETRKQALLGWEAARLNHQGDFTGQASETRLVSPTISP